MKRTLLAAAVAVGLAVPASADYWADFEAAIEAYLDGDFAAARRGFEPLAERGDNRAQYWFGIMYFEGNGVPRDHLRAYLWLSLAAEGGNRAAKISRSGIARRLSATEIAEAERMIAAWRPAE